MQHQSSDVITQVREWFADDSDLIENTSWEEVDLFTEIRRGLSQKFGSDTAGPIALALEVVLRRLAVEQSASCVPTSTAIRHAITRLERLAEIQEATESLLPKLSS